MHAQDWTPFTLVPQGDLTPITRDMKSIEGRGDRLRVAAFAEMQAREAFLGAATRYTDAPEELRDAWRRLAREEDKHLGWLLKRMQELGQDPAARGVSDALWRSFKHCETAKDFALFMAAAEERGRVAGERFAAALQATDPETARIFGQIALEERAHIELARRFFPEEWTHALSQKIVAPLVRSPQIH